MRGYHGLPGPPLLDYSRDMLTLYHAPRTRSVRIRWLLEELELPHRLERRPFQPPSGGFFSQGTPTGKFPVLVDDDATFCESGAILEYVLERYGEGRLAPPPGSPERGRFLQWVHYSEGTAYPPLGTLIWHVFYRGDHERVPEVMEDARGRAGSALRFLEDGLGDGPWLLGDDFSGADIMTGFTLAIARFVGVLGGHPKLTGYLERLEARPALQRAMAD